MFRINPASGKAIYEQIMEQVKEAAWKGYLKPGDALPSVRRQRKDARDQDKFKRDIK